MLRPSFGLGALCVGWVASCSAPDGAAIPGGAAPEASTAQEAGAMPGPVPDPGAAASAETTDAAPSAFHSAPHPPAPEEVSYGGKVLAHPRFVPVTFDGDPFRANIESLLDAIGASTYWAAVTAEYGVSAAVRGRPVHLAEPVPSLLTDAALKSWLASKLDGTHPEFEPPNEGTVYVIYLPAGTTYTLPGATGCVQFGASDTFLELANGTKVPFIAIPRCPPHSGLGAWDALSATTSHELFEESTDPFKDAWVTLDRPHVAWSLEAPFSEIGDVCFIDPTAYFAPSDVGSAVQRAWSNRAAAAGHNPCVPAPAGVAYFNAAPVLADDVSFLSRAGVMTTKGVHVAVGDSRTIEVDLFSDAPTPPWRVRAFDMTATTQKGGPDLELTLDRDHGQNGDKLALTIHVLRAGTIGGSRFALVSDDGVHSAFWLGLVEN